MAKEWFARKSITINSEKIDLKVRRETDVTINNASVITSNAFTKTIYNNINITPSSGTITSISQLGGPITSSTFQIKTRKIGVGLLSITIPRFVVTTFTNSGSIGSLHIGFTQNSITYRHWFPITLTQAGNDYHANILVESTGITITFNEIEFSFADTCELKGDYTFIVAPNNA